MRGLGWSLIVGCVASCHPTPAAAPRAELPPPRAVEMVVQIGHAGPITEATFSPDGRLVATGSYDHTVKLWDTATGKLIRTFAGHPSVSRFVRFLDDARLTSFDLDGDTAVWDIATGARLLHFDAFRDPADRNDDLTALAVSADGRTVVAGERAGVVWIRDLATGEVGSFAIHDHGRPSGCEDAPVPWISFAGDPGLLSVYVSDDGATGTSRALEWDGCTPTIGTRSWRTESGQEVVATRQAWDATVATGGVDDVGHPALIARSGDGRLGLFALAPPPLPPEPALSGDTERAVSSIGAPDPALERPAPLGVWDLALGAQIATIGGATRTLREVSLLPGRALAVTDDNRLAWWDLDSAKLLGDVSGAAAYRAALTSDGVHAIVQPDWRLAWQLWDLDAGREIRAYPGDHQDPLGQLPGATIAAGDGSCGLPLADPGEPDCWPSCILRCDRAFELWDDASGARVATAPGSSQVRAAAGSADGRRIVSASGEPVIRVWDATTGALLREIDVGEPIDAVAISPDGRLALATGPAMTIAVLDTETGRRLHTLAGHTAAVAAMAFSPDGGLAATGSADGTVRLWDVADGRARRTLTGHDRDVLAVAFSRDGRFVISAGHDATIKRWSVETDDVLTMASSGGEWIAFSQDGLFDASRRGGELVAMVDGTRAFGVEQFAVRNNRPDLLFARFGLGDDETIARFARQAERRARRAGLAGADAAAALHAPEAVIVGAVTDGKWVELDVRFSDDLVALASYRIYVNGVPVADAPLDGRAATVHARVELAAGDNRLEASATNADGAESRRAMTSARWDGDAHGDLYFVGFGVSRHRDPALDLGYAHKDAADLAHLFGALGGYDHVHASVFTDAEVTRAALRDARALLAGAGVDDTVVVFVAGHGLHDDDPDETYYFVTADADPARLADTAAPLDEIEALIGEGAARRRLLLLDTCESGDAEDDAATDDLDGLRSRAIVRRAKAPRAVTWDRDRYVFNDVERRTGAIVLSSSRGGEASYEDPALEHGLFTAAVIDALTTSAADPDGDARVPIATLAARVAEDVAARSRGRQHPVVDRDNPDQAFDLPIATGLVLPPVAPSPPHVAPAPRGCACDHRGDTPPWPLTLIVLLLWPRPRRARRAAGAARPRSGARPARASATGR